MKIKNPTKRTEVSGRRWNRIVKRDKGVTLSGAMREAITSQGFPACAAEAGSWASKTKY